MIKNSLFFKVLTRYLKEKEMFHIFKKYIDDDVIASLDKDKCYVYGYLLSRLGNIISDIHGSELKNENLNFFHNLSNQSEFHSLLLEKCKDIMNEFMSDKNYKNLFSYNLLLQRRKILMLYGFKDNYIYPNDDIIIAYYSYMTDNGISPFNLISAAFDWEYSNEKYSFWHKISMEYRVFLWNKLTD